MIWERTRQIDVDSQIAATMAGRAARVTAAMNPHFFGTSQRRLFGIYSAARSAGALQGGRGVVICNPWGPEYLYAHRSLRYLANALCANGIHALRFDYFGTGDSAGDATEVTLSGGRADIGAAVQELRDTTSLARVSLIGLRLGATLAAQVARSCPEQLDRLVLWEPIVSGSDYVRELCPNGGDGVKEILGFPVSDELLRELPGVDLAAELRDQPGPTLLIAADAAALAQRLQATARCEPLGSRDAGDTAVWHPQRGLGVAAIPLQLTARIVEWLGA
jgi:pimeloyl-ACP methyl ester carboxylesterase